MSNGRSRVKRSLRTQKGNAQPHIVRTHIGTTQHITHTWPSSSFVKKGCFQNTCPGCYSLSQSLCANQNCGDFPKTYT